MRVTLLGTGTSGGVPSLGCHCRVCESPDIHDKRLRCVALLETDRTRLLIDCGPDIRQQLMPLPFKPVDGVLITHTHYDHVGGIDDLRPFCHFGDINIYADAAANQRLHQTMPYCFGEHLYPGVPKLNLHRIVPHEQYAVGDITFVPFIVMHGKLPIMGYRFSDFAYITDMKTMAEEEKEYLEGVKTLVINALRFEKEHHSHQLVSDAVAFSREIGATCTRIIHCSHQIGRHKEVNMRLPQDIKIGYDGEVLNVSSSF